jgi:putative redox protein
MLAALPLARLSQQPTMSVRIEIQYQGNLRCEATHGPSSSRLHTDAPVDNHGKGENFSPTDLVATALASCMATVMGIKARMQGYDIPQLKVTIEKEMSQDLPRRIVRLPVTVEVGLPASHPDRQILESAALSCPVLNSLHPGINKPVNFLWME